MRPTVQVFGPEQEREKGPLRGARGSIISLTPTSLCLGSVVTYVSVTNAVIIKMDHNHYGSKVILAFSYLLIFSFSL